MSIILPRIIGKRNNINYLVFPLIISVLFAGLRGNVGTDVFAYKTYFNTLNFNIAPYETIGGLKFSFEPGFAILTIIIRTIYNNEQFYIFALSLLYGYLFYLLLQKLKEKDLYFLFYISTYYIVFDFNLLRFGIAMLLIGNAYLLLLNNEKGIIKYLIPAFLIHYATFFISYSFINKHKIFFYIILFLSVLIFAFTFIQSKVNIYFLLTAGSFNDFEIKYGLIFEFLLLLFLIFKDKNLQNNNFYIIVVLYFSLKWFNYLWDIVERLAYVFGFILNLYIFREKQSIRAKYIIWLFIILNLYRTLSFLSNSDAAMAKLVAEQPGFSILFSQTKYLPYRFFWE